MSKQQSHITSNFVKSAVNLNSYWNKRLLEKPNCTPCKLLQKPKFHFRGIWNYRKWLCTWW